jgi:4'-phosphopantetheinyl transferase
VWLRPDERERAARFRFERDRELYLSSRVMLRGLLSRYSDASPGEWKFEANPFGKPRAVSARGAGPEFSLSHTHGLVCCAISAGAPVGVDAEPVDRTVDVEDIVEKYCSAFERHDLASRDNRARRVRFMSYWTLKESLTKAMGCGLSIDVSRLSFDIQPDDIRVAEDPLLGDPASWSFSLFQPTPEHTMAVSVRSRRGADAPASLREAAFEHFQ